MKTSTVAHALTCDFNPRRPQTGAESRGARTPACSVETPLDASAVLLLPSAQREVTPLFRPATPEARLVRAESSL